MNGDILDRLHMAILVCDHDALNGGGPMGPDPNSKECSECNFFRDAADEISRLRWQIQGMKDSMDHLEEISKSQRETMTKYLFPEEAQQ